MLATVSERRGSKLLPDAKRVVLKHSVDKALSYLAGLRLGPGEKLLTEARKDMISRIVHERIDVL